MTRTIDIEFDIGQKVLVYDLDSWATVEEISISYKGTKYLVEYFHNGKREEAWLYASELRSKKEENAGQG